MKMNGTIEFFYHKNIGLDTKTFMISGLVQKLWLKMPFHEIVVNAMRTTYIQTTQDIFYIL